MLSGMSVMHMLNIYGKSRCSRIQQNISHACPKGAFFALISLYYLYIVLGVRLTIIAVAAVVKGKGVRDAQARLSIDAIVAESFESPAWGDDATQIDKLYAERRGKVIKRIALSRRDGGGRRYRQIVLREEEED